MNKNTVITYKCGDVVWWYALGDVFKRYHPQYVEFVQTDPANPDICCYIRETINEHILKVFISDISKKRSGPSPSFYDVPIEDEIRPERLFLMTGAFQDAAIAGAGIIIAAAIIVLVRHMVML